VVSNAGILHTLEFDQLTPEQYQRMRAVHLDGGFYLSQAAFRVMKTQGYGRFVFISSSAGMFGQPNSAHYAAAKAGLVGLANVIAIEGAAHGILANTVLPFGYSRMVTDTVGEDAESLREQSEFLRSIAPELVVPAVVFLASQTCTITHHIYSAMAGRFARVFVGLGDGWEADRGTTPTAEDVAEHFDQLSQTEPFTVPMSIFDEISLTIERLGITS
jgi:NAD(P)-dependent dehydrogenase (short-subunit alcohol dehydrogenase family)